MRGSARKRISALIPFAAGLAVAVLLAGCELAPEIRGPELEHNYQPSDLPVPLSFEFDERNSWAYIKFAHAPLEVRSGEFVYHGDRPLLELAHWYMEQMPIEGWKHKNTVDRDDIQMTFEKGRELAVIDLRRVPDDKGEFYVTRLVARIRPR